MRIYFSGIGGVAIGPLAEIALDAGYDIAGSDPIDSLMTHELNRRGVKISTDQSGEFLRGRHEETPFDWFVYTAALPSNHPELVLATKLGLKTVKRDQLLARIIAEKNLKLIAIAGTHGKTTTTGMMVWALKQLGVPVSYSIGTTLSWGPSGFFDPQSEFFVYECDEFDRNFLRFQPYLSLITNVEHDHPDTYPTEAAYFEAFSQFAAQSQRVVTWEDEAKNITLPQSSWLLSNNDIQGFSLAGLHNRKNATLVAKGIEYLQLAKHIDGTNTSLKIMNAFPGTNRRMEKLADNLYSDYGHTPTEIAATLQLARELSDHVTLVYQPHQNVRQHEIRDQYTDEVFKNADEVFWLPTYLSRETSELPIIAPTELTKNLSHENVTVVDLDDDLWAEITRRRDAGQLVLTMGAGSIDGWVRSKL